MNPGDELERLLTDLFDAAPDAARNQKLRDLLYTHPELQERYLEYLQLHALLQWRGGKATPIQPPELPSEKPTPAPEAPHRPTRGWGARRGLAAAVLFLAACLALVFLSSMPEANAAPDVFDQLIELNLELAHAKSPEERTRIYADQAAELQAVLAKSELVPEDRALAQRFLENGSILTKNADPIFAAGRFDELAGKILDRLNAVVVKRDETRIVRFAEAYQRLTEEGVEANVKRALATGPLDGDEKQKLDQVLHRDESRSKKLEQMIERNPPSRKAIHRGMKAPVHRMRKKMRTSR